MFTHGTCGEGVIIFNISFVQLSSTPWSIMLPDDDWGLRSHTPIPPVGTGLVPAQVSISVSVSVCFLNLVLTFLDSAGPEELCCIFCLSKTLHCRMEAVRSTSWCWSKSASSSKGGCIWGWATVGALARNLPEEGGGHVSSFVTPRAAQDRGPKSGPIPSAKTPRAA